MSLPVGLDLTGRRVVVVGGGPRVASSLRAVLAAGAVVEVVAPWVCEDVAEHVATGEVAWTQRD